MRIFTTDGSCSKNPGPGSYCSIEWEDRDGQLYIVYNKIELVELQFSMKGYAL